MLDFKVTQPDPPVTPADLERAGFVFLDKIEARKNHDVRFLVHRQVLEMPPDQQAEQPWVEWGRWAAWLDKPDFIEGRWGSLRYSFRTLDQLYSFMDYWRYRPGLD